MKTGLWARAALAAGVGGLSAGASAIDLQNATATFSQTQSANFFASTMIDGIISPFGNGWAIYDATAAGGNFTTAQSAAFETVTDLNASAIRVFLHQEYFDGQHNVGRFRISVTNAHRSTFCDGLQTGGNVGTIWTTLLPGIQTFPAGTTVTLMADFSLRLGGPNTGGVYSVTYNLPYAGVTGIRLDVVEDPTLPTDGPGRYTNGNFVISELRVTKFPCVGDMTAGAVPSAPGYGVPNGLVDNDDFFYFLAQFAAGNVAVCDLTTGAIPAQPGYGVPNGVLNNEDFFYFLAAFSAGC